MDNNLFPGAPLIESPIFMPDALPSEWSAEEKFVARHLHQNGFAVIDFPDPEIGARIDRVKRSLGPRFNLELDNPHSNKTGGSRRIQDAWSFDDDVRAIACNPAILDLLSKLYGRAAFPFQTLNFPVGTQQDAHSDVFSAFFEPAGTLHVRRLAGHGRCFGRSRAAILCARVPPLAHHEQCADRP